jgi:hypothetical protein
MGKSDLVQKVGGPIHCWFRGPKIWETGPHGGYAYAFHNLQQYGNLVFVACLTFSKFHNESTHQNEENYDAIIYKYSKDAMKKGYCRGA